MGVTALLIRTYLYLIVK